MYKAIALWLLIAIMFGVALDLYRGSFEETPITCSANKIMIVAKNGYFCVENAIQIQ